MTTTITGAVFKLRRDTSSAWAAKNPVLASGEPGYERDTRGYKIGDGHTPWIDLHYVLADQGDDSEGAAMLALQQHIVSLTPHSVYDDGPSLTLLYENAKV